MLENIGKEKVNRDKPHDKELCPVKFLKTKNNDNKSDMNPRKEKTIYKE